MKRRREHHDNGSNSIDGLSGEMVEQRGEDETWPKGPTDHCILSELGIQWGDEWKGCILSGTEDWPGTDSEQSRIDYHTRQRLIITPSPSSTYVMTCPLPAREQLPRTRIRRWKCRLMTGDHRGLHRFCALRRELERSCNWAAGSARYF